MDTLAARQQMVDQQIRTWEVLDPRVLEVLAQVPREAFVPQSCRDLAFADSELPIGSGQSMLAPKIQGQDPAGAGRESHGQRARDRYRNRLSIGVFESAMCLHALDRHSSRSHRHGGGQLAHDAQSAASGSTRATPSTLHLWANTMSSPSLDRYRCTTRASSAACGSAADCSLWWDRRPSWMPCSYAASTMANGFARVCSRR